jgi:hypothetical protein
LTQRIHAVARRYSDALIFECALYRRLMRIPDSRYKDL